MSTPPFFYSQNQHVPDEDVRRAFQTAATFWNDRMDEGGCNRHYMAAYVACLLNILAEQGNLTPIANIAEVMIRGVDNGN